MKAWLALAALILATAVHAQDQATIPAPESKAASTTAQASSAVQRTIDDELWRPFMAHFNAGEADAYLALRAPGFVRVATAERSVQGLAEYAQRTRTMIERLRERGIAARIELRFDDRMAGDGLAWETGIWAVTITRSGAEPMTSYGRFRVVLVQHEGRWRLAMDQDEPLDAHDGARLFAAARPLGTS